MAEDRPDYNSEYQRQFRREYAEREGGILLLTVAQAAERARVSRRTISNWIASGRLLAIRDGRRKLIPLDHLQQLFVDRFQSPGHRLPP